MKQQLQNNRIISLEGMNVNHRVLPKNSTYASTAFSTPKTKNQDHEKTKSRKLALTFRVHKQKIYNKSDLVQSPKFKQLHECSSRKKRVNFTQHYQKTTQKQINWIVYNMLVGIYANWLRIGPLIFYLLGQTQRGKIKDLEQMIKNVMKDKERIESILKRCRTDMNTNQFCFTYQMEVDPETIQLVDKILRNCNEFKCSTKVLNGQIFAKKRALKTEKQNILANNLFEIMDKNNKNSEGGRRMLINDNVERVAEAIVDRIAVVSYMRKNNIKIDDKILKPLKNIFLDQSNFEKEKQITTAKIIEKIKQKFNISTSAVTSHSKQVHHSVSLINRIYEQKKKEKTKQNESDGNGQDSNNEFDRINQGVLNGNKGEESGAKKKMGLILDTEGSDNEIKQKGYTKNRNINLYQLYNQRKVVLNRQAKRSKLKKTLTDLQNELKEMSEQQNQQPIKNEKNDRQDRPNKKQKLKLQIYDKSKQIDKEREDIMQKDRLGQKDKDKSRQRNRRYFRRGLSKSKKTSDLSVDPKEGKSLKKLTKNPSSKAILNSFSSFSSEEDDSLQLDGSKRKSNSRKYIKPGRLLRKKMFKNSHGFFHNLNLDDFDMQLEAEGSVVNKKRKILNLFSTLEAEGLITTNQITKLISQARNLPQQLFRNMKRVRFRKGHTNSDIPTTSFFHIPTEDEEADKIVPESKPYQYLKSFNQEAKKCWIGSKYDYNTKYLKILDFNTGRHSGLNCDLSIPVSKKQNKNCRKLADQQNEAIQLGLNLIKRRNWRELGQKILFKEEAK